MLKKKKKRERILAGYGGEYPALEGGRKISLSLWPALSAIESSITVRVTQ